MAAWAIYNQSDGTFAHFFQIWDYTFQWDDPDQDQDDPDQDQ